MNIEHERHEMYRVGEIVSQISSGILQLPEYMTDFTWGEEEIINLLNNFYYGIYTTNILLIDSESYLRRSPNGSDYYWDREIKIPSRRLYRRISKKSFKSQKSKTFREDDKVYYIVDGHHRLQSLYLAWYGFFNGKRLYFKINATNEKPFHFLRPADCDPRIHRRLAKVKYVSVPDLPFIDQVNKNCERFCEMFLRFCRISCDFIDINDPFFDQMLSDTLDKKPDTKIIADRIRFIRENYISNNEQ